MTNVTRYGWKKPPLSLNDRAHWRTRYETGKSIREAVALSHRNLGPSPSGHVTVRMVWWVNTRGVRDEDNPVATLKPMCDGLVDAGLVPDDSPKYMTKLPVRIIYRPASEGAACVELHVTEGHPPEVTKARQILDTHDDGLGGCACDGCILAYLVLGV